MKILCIHGIGGKDRTLNQWKGGWEKTITESAGITDTPEFDFLLIDDLFSESKDRMGIKYGEGLAKFIKSWIKTSLFDSSGSKGILDEINWYAGMPMQFITDSVLRQKLAERLHEKIVDFKPDLIYAHSLGTLICYDFFRSETVLGNKHSLVLITSGSQIGHPALRQQFGGSIQPIAVKHWVNFHNENDRVFASRPITIQSDNYNQFETSFSRLFNINHNVLEYMSHESAINFGWPLALIKTAMKAKELASVAKLFSQTKTIRRTPNKKALLIGINNYPDAANQLNGCVNDVFRMSETLQEHDFAPEQIRVLLDERATASAIRERLAWLLSDTSSNDTRFFFFSGHGAQIPTAHNDIEEDETDECIVPYDFDWTTENAYTDKEFLELYSQLPYDSNFFVMLDCCHSGGMSRSGLSKARGLNPPDDINHRSIKWDPTRQMWIDRKSALKTEKYFNAKTKNTVQYTGLDGKTNRLGRAIPLWTSNAEFEVAKKKYDHKGAFVPVMLEACMENELAWEYKHGVTSYGAFTYALTTLLRQKQNKNINLTFNELIAQTCDELKSLNYKQTPTCTGPNKLLDEKVPFPKYLSESKKTKK